MSDSHYVMITLKSSVIQRYLENASLTGTAPVSMNQLSFDVFQSMNRWCETNCQGDWDEGMNYYWFELANDAMLFKLTHA